MLKILFTALTFISLLGDMTGTDENCCEYVSSPDSFNAFDCLEDNATQDPIVVNWELLVDIESKPHFYKELGMEAPAPQFRQMQKDLDGKEVIIKGFVIPIDELGITLALSKYPFANCFFCGKASPASVMGLYPKKIGKRYKIDDFISFRGTLHLNYDDPYEFFYVLKDAREI